MSRVYFVTPSKRPPAEVNPILALWRERGYQILLQRDPGDPAPECEYITREYVGHAEAVNYLCRYVIESDAEVRWIVNAGDDTEPDANHTAAEIARDCSIHFAEGFVISNPGPIADIYVQRAATFGVMQPTGDYKLWPNSDIRKIAGSPWLGREFCRRMYQGTGPMWPEYFHQFNDEELWHVANNLGVLWLRDDLIHKHHHWARTGARKNAPEFLARANSAANWTAMKTLFENRKSRGFPGSEPIA